MTKQEIFDTVVNGLRTQGYRQASVARGICKYKTENGDKCAAGQLLPDDKYDSVTEGIDCFQPVFHEIVGSENLGFLSALQSIHDRGEEVIAFNKIFWEKEWQEFAHKYDLVYTLPHE